MCRVIVFNVQDGLVPTEKVVQIKSADGGSEELSLSVRQVFGDRIVASEIGRDGDKVLVELPRETATGRWRMWVPQSSVQGV